MLAAQTLKHLALRTRGAQRIRQEEDADQLFEFAAQHSLQGRMRIQSATRVAVELMYTHSAGGVQAVQGHKTTQEMPSMIAGPVCNNLSGACTVQTARCCDDAHCLPFRYVRPPYTSLVVLHTALPPTLCCSTASAREHHGDIVLPQLQLFIDQRMRSRHACMHALEALTSRTPVLCRRVLSS